LSIFLIKILLATDGSEEATLAARAAVDLADKANSELHVVNIRMQEYGYPIYAVPEFVLSPSHTPVAAPGPRGPTLIGPGLL
jgi:nucleotide-binding universal stress UspA family protein